MFQSAPPAGRSLAVFLLVCTVLPMAFAQMAWPIQGQNLPPPGITQVTVDIVVEEIRAIKSESNSWHAVHWFHLAWEDPRAAAAIQKSTQDWIAAGVNGSSLAGGCTLPCDSSKQPTAGCCDAVWLPHLDATNLIALDQEAAYRWRIWVAPTTNPATGAVVGGTRVHWAVRTTGEWQSPFDFRAWPFEHQHLLTELQISASLADRVYLAFGIANLTSNTPTAKGDPVPGWYKSKITKRAYNNTACFSRTNATSIYSISDDGKTVTFKPLPASAWLQSSPSAIQANHALAINQVDTCDLDADHTAALAQYGPQVLVMDIMVRRTQIYYVLANILPLLLLDYMVFITYAMERNDLESRMGVIVTLVLSVSALQFTYNFPPASYLNAVQQITLMSYVLYFIVAVQSMITAHICRHHARKRMFQRITSLAAKRDPQSGGTVLGIAAHRSMLGPTQEEDGEEQHDDHQTIPYGARAMTTAGSDGDVPHVAPSGVSNLGKSRVTPVGGLGLDAGPRSSSVTGPTTAQASRMTTPRTSDQMGTRPPPASAAQLAATELARRRTSASGHADDHLTITMQATAATTSSPGGMNSLRGVSVYDRRLQPGPLGEGHESPFYGETSDTDPGAPRDSRSNKAGCAACFRTTRRRKNTRADSYEGPGTGAVDAKGVPLDVPPKEGARRPSRSSLDNISIKRAASSVKQVANKTREMQKRIDADEAYAYVVATRLDQIFSWSLLIAFTVTVAVLLYVNRQVGDHKLMLQGSAPANM